MRTTLKFLLFFTFILLIATNLDVFAIEPRDVGFVNRYMINTDGRNFEITFSANFLISSNAFSANDKMLQFDIETALDKENIGEIIVPRDLIDGKFTVLLNGEEISAKVSKSSKSSVISIEFDGKGKHTLEITLQELPAMEVHPVKEPDNLIVKMFMPPPTVFHDHGIETRPGKVSIQVPGIQGQAIPIHLATNEVEGNTTSVFPVKRNILVGGCGNRNDTGPEVRMSQPDVPGGISTHRMAAEKDAIGIHCKMLAGITQ